MTKSELLRDNNSCLGRAHDDEPVFVLRAKDPLAAQTLRLWASMARGVHENDKVERALEEAKLMDEWRADFGATRKAPPRDDSVPTSGSGASALLERGKAVASASGETERCACGESGCTGWRWRAQPSRVHV